MAYYDSQQKLLWVEAQLTDASYLFDKNCRLTGGFALVSWMSKGEFLLSMGGYHPKFKAPSYYPEVPRLGFNWKPISKLTIKGGAYFTVCTSAVMLGGNLEASFKAGSLSASFKAGTNILVVFDPFYYSFDVYIGVSVRLKTWLGTLKGSLGADLEIEGPKMRGKGELNYVSFHLQSNLDQVVAKHSEKSHLANLLISMFYNYLKVNLAHRSLLISVNVASTRRFQVD